MAGDGDDGGGGTIGTAIDFGGGGVARRTEPTGVGADGGFDALLASCAELGREPSAAAAAVKTPLTALAAQEGGSMAAGSAMIANGLGGDGCGGGRSGGLDTRATVRLRRFLDVQHHLNVRLREVLRGMRSVHTLGRVFVLVVHVSVLFTAAYFMRPSPVVGHLKDSVNRAFE
eukprot:366030-Chlamydomonas_euryale.AAC.10